MIIMQERRPAVKMKVRQQIDQITDRHAKDDLAHDDLDQHGKLIRLSQQHRDRLIARRKEDRRQRSQRDR